MAKANKKKTDLLSISPREVARQMAMATKRMHEWFRLSRWALVCFTICFCFAFACWMLTRIFDNGATWPQVALAVVTIVGGLIAPNIPQWGWLIHYRRTIGKQQVRTVELEKLVDPKRTSSNVKVDGTHDLDQ